MYIYIDVFILVIYELGKSNKTNRI